ncbi:MAG: hypothetical protein AAB801_00360 [Patescibacteria group bacterium]
MIPERFKTIEGDFLKALIFFFFAFLFGNILVLDLLFLKSPKKELTSDKSESAKVSVDSQNQTLCPASCIARIEEATSSSGSSNKKASEEEDAEDESTASSTKIRESLITLGTGTNASTDYENVATTQVYIDPSKYGTIKSVKFEVSIAVPTANQFVYVRLYNITDKNPVWNSELYMSGGPSSFLESDPITLASGNKLYVVQMKSQLKHQTNLNQARLRIESY